MFISLAGKETSCTEKYIARAFDIINENVDLSI